MNNETRLISFLAALGVAAGLYGLLDRPSEGSAPNVAPSQTPPVAQNEPAAVEPPPLTPPASAKPPAIARVPVRDAPKQVPASPPPTPVAALGSDAGQPAGIGPQGQNPAAERPDSVAGWGPWSAGAQPGGATTGAPTSPDGTPSVLGHNPTVNAAAGTPPPAVVPPPASSPPGTNPPGTNPPGTSSSIRPGYGWGDRNHIHIPRRDK